MDCAAPCPCRISDERPPASLGMSLRASQATAAPSAPQPSRTLLVPLQCTGGPAPPLDWAAPPPCWMTGPPLPAGRALRSLANLGSTATRGALHSGRLFTIPAVPQPAEPHPPTLPSPLRPKAAAAVAGLNPPPLGEGAQCRCCCRPLGLERCTPCRLTLVSRPAEMTQRDLPVSRPHCGHAARCRLIYTGCP